MCCPARERLKTNGATIERRGAGLLAAEGHLQVRDPWVLEEVCG